MNGKGWIVVAGLVSVCGSGLPQAPVEREGGHIDLPTSKRIVGLVPGDPQRTNSLPVSMAVSPDGRYVVTVNGGWGTVESGYAQSLTVMNTQTGKVADFPDFRTVARSSSNQVLFSGLAFSGDGKHLYGSIVSATDPEGKKAGDTGSGIAVYSFFDGKVTPERVLKIPPMKLAGGRTTKLGPGGGVGLPYPAAIAVLPAPPEDGNLSLVLVADNLSDDAFLMDAASGKVLMRFDLSENDDVPTTYPGVVALSKDGTKGYVGLWNASEVVELDLKAGTVARKLKLLPGLNAIAASSHPSAMQLSPDGRTLYVALANRDAVTAVDVADGAFAVKGYFDVRLPGQTYYGAQPEGLAVSADGKRLYCANMGSDSVAVLDTAALKKYGEAKGRKRDGMVEPLGFVPTEWLPMAVAATGGKLYVATGKGTGTGPNNFPQEVTPSVKGVAAFDRPFAYIPSLLHGSLAAVDEAAIATNLKALTEETLVDNRMKAAEEKLPFAAGQNPIRHVIYIIKENRTYDQLFGDLPVGNGDKSLTMYGTDITPNQHKLALQFGVLDNFFDSGEVSGDGHVWSNAAIGTDYLERTWELNYRGGQHGYDFEGVVSQGYPILQKIPDVNEPASGYLWGNLAAHGKSYYHFGEFIATTFCTDKGAASAELDPTKGPMLEGKRCSRNEVKPGEKFPEVWGGEVNKFPWAVPLIAENIPTKPELVGHFAPETPDFDLLVPDQVRVDVFLRHLKGWVADREAGKDTMPDFVMLRLANDHTAGTRPGAPTPKASVADNDLAIGRAVEAISHSKYWDDTAFFILEDDAQNGADHVDAHRSMALAISKYAPHKLVDSRFYSTVSMVRTMETLLGLPPMNNNDAFSSLMSAEFSGKGDQAPFVADFQNRDNGLIYTANKRTAPGARASSKMDFRHADHADPHKLNVILWQDAMGNKPVPPMLLEKRKIKKDDDD
jgi:DNA-binding beta-propeller fold protein YncE